MPRPLPHDGADGEVLDACEVRGRPPGDAQARRAAYPGLHRREAGGMTDETQVPRAGWMTDGIWNPDERHRKFLEFEHWK